MKLTVKYQESYSRGELLLRTFFGAFYIALPHMFLLLFVGLWGSILSFISFWIVLFTGRYPESFFEFQVGLYKWQLRVNARIMNLSDGYPAFGMKGEDEYTSLEIPYPENLSRGLALVKALFGIFYVLLPHGFLLLFRAIATQFVVFIAWWAVLFTGRFPESMHTFVTGYLRWTMRVNLYMGYMTDEYPPFTGKEV
jgi:hypothetical protein